MLKDEFLLSFITKVIKISLVRLNPPVSEWETQMKSVKYVRRWNAKQTQ